MKKKDKLEMHVYVSNFETNLGKYCDLLLSCLFVTSCRLKADIFSKSTALLRYTMPGNKLLCR